MTTTLGIAVAPHYVALVLVERRSTGTVTLDQVLLDTASSATTPRADASQQVLAEVEHTMAVLDAHKRTFSRVAVAAVEPTAAVTAINIVDALTEAGLTKASLVAHASNENSFAGIQSGNPRLPTDRALTAAHELAVDALALVPAINGRPLVGGRTRQGLAIAATAVATIGIGVMGFRLLTHQAEPEITPVESTHPAPTEVTQRAATSPSPTAAGVNVEPTPTTVVDTIVPVPPTIAPAEVPAPSTMPPTSAPTQDALPSPVDITPTPQDGAPPAAPAPPPSPEPPPPPPQGVEPHAPADQQLPGPVPPPPAEPQASQPPP